MASSLDSTYGIFLITLFLETILYGMGILQVWLYFHWYPKDRWVIKASVLLLTLFETLQVTFFFASAYVCLIKNYGNPIVLDVLNWEDSTQLICGYLSAFIVQCYFAYCIYILTNKNLLITSVISIFALTQIGAGIAQTIISGQLAFFSKLDQSKAVTTVQSCASWVCDISITVSLCYTLYHRKNGAIEATNSMVNTLMIYAINRGILTAIFACLNMILFLALPGTFYFFIGLMMSSKLYMNSMLASLNTRQHIRDNSEIKNDWRSIPIETMNFQPASMDNSREVYNLGRKQYPSSDTGKQHV